MKNLKKNLSLGLSLLLAAGTLSPVATFATENTGDKKASTEVSQPADQGKENKENKEKEEKDKALNAAKEALTVKITEAEALVKTKVAEKAEDVKKGEKFALKADHDKLVAAVTAAKEAVNKADATVETLTEAKTTLETAMNTFNGAIKEGTKEDKKEDKPATETDEQKIARLEAEVAKLQAELNKAGTDKAALQKKIDELNKEITELKAKIEKKETVNKLFLERVLKTLKAIKKEDLVKADQDKYAKILVEAQVLYANAKATQAEVDQMASNVLDFLYTAKYQDTVADQRQLKKVLEDAKKIKEKDLARRDWSDLQKLIKEAEEILADRKASQRDVDGIQKDLDKLIKDIVSYKVDIKDLEKLVNAAEKLDVDKFARRDRYEFEKCLNDAKSLLRDPAATQREVDRAHDNLKGFLKDVAKDGGEIAKDINKMLNKTGDVDVTKALSKSRALFNLPVLETRTLDANAKLSSLRYVFTINSERFAEVTNQAINVYKMDTAPFIQDNRTMVPLRYAAYTLQADVSWDQATKTATFTKNGVSAYVTLGSNLVRMSNGQNFNMDTAPVVRNNRMHVSISNIAKMFGEKSGTYNDGQDNRIEWDAQNRAVIVYVAK